MWHNFLFLDNVRVTQNLQIGCTLKVHFNIFKSFVILKILLQYFSDTYWPTAAVKVIDNILTGHRKHNCLLSH
jgi:hypothetical protein